MRKTGVVVAVVVALAGCGQPDSKTRATQDARDVAMVERMSKAPLVPLVPEAISSAQMTRLGLGRVPCAFSLSQDGPAVFLAGRAEGFMQIDGEIQRLAAREQSARLPGDARTTFIGLKNWAEFQRLAGDDGRSDAVQFPMRLVVHDAQERVVFTADGTMACIPPTIPPAPASTAPSRP